MIWCSTSKSTNFTVNHKEFRNTQSSEKLALNIHVIKLIRGRQEISELLVAIVDHQDTNEYCCSGQSKSQGFVVQSCISSANCKECNISSDNGFRIVAQITDLYL